MPYDYIFLPIAAYFLGSIPFGVLLSRYCSDVNIREGGSRNIGATNVWRLAGIKPGLFTLAADVLKGLAPVCLAVELAGRYGGWEGEAYVSLVALSVFFGHLYSIFLNLDGGKGVATAAGCMVVIAPVPLFLSIIGFAVTLHRWRYVSAGSLTGAVLLPVGVWLFMESIFYLCLSIIMAFFMFFKLQDNIKRLFAGTESRFSP